MKHVFSLLITAVALGLLCYAEMIFFPRSDFSDRDLKKVAITGGVSCGVSSVCELLQDLEEVSVVKADDIIEDLLYEDEEVYRAVVDLLGEEVLSRGRLDRVKIGRAIFAEPDLLYALEAILHPRVHDKIEELYQKERLDPQASLFIVDYPLLFEERQEPFFDEVVAVVANPDIARERFIRAYSDDEEFNRRSSFHLSNEEKMKRADFVIWNEGSFPDLKEQVENFLMQTRS